MGIGEAFDDFQKIVNADKDRVDVARGRRDIFKKAFNSEADIVETFGSGSLARSTQLDPVHDVDLVVVYNREDHPEWGNPGKSAADALEHTRGRVKDLLGATYGTVDKLVRHTRWRNHAVKCFIDPPDFPDGFTVDVMPAFRQADNTLLVPQAATEEWITVDPEYLIRAVANHQRDWEYFRPLVRVLKRWRHSVPTKVKSLVMEVLALRCMPHSGNRPEALRSFFTAAAIEVNLGVVDPAGHCGSIQDDLDIPVLHTALANASDIAARACAEAANGNTDDALRAWQEIFGSDFPAPAKSSSAGVAAPALITTRLVRDAPQG
jgi:Second Messenger Oligonucleotide or Dinucleotide Synthetase domain